MSHSEFKEFMASCHDDLCLPDDMRLDDYLEFLEAFTSEVREQAERKVGKEIGYEVHLNHKPEPSDAEREARVDELVHERLRDCGRKLAKLLTDGI